MAKLNRNPVVDIRKQSSSQPQFETRISIPKETRAKIVTLLNARLADTLDMQTQTKFAHWNVKGNDFYQLHLLFDQVAEHLEDAVDMIAERVTALGGRADGTLRQAAAVSSIPEYAVATKAGMDHVRELSDHLALLANAAREAIQSTAGLQDQATSDLFTELVRAMDKDLYFLEAHLRA